MLEWFTDGAKGAVVAADNEAVALEANAIETKHILLGLLGARDEVVTGALTEAGLAERTPPPSPPLPRIHIPFTPGSKKALERAREDSGAFGEQLVRPGHLLLALLREDGDDGAIKMLQDQGVDVSWLRDRVSALLRS
jgi:ATP-dependent Clp protease ATP-binding subunit ClpA